LDVAYLHVPVYFTSSALRGSGCGGMSSSDRANVGTVSTQIRATAQALPRDFLAFDIEPPPRSSFDLKEQLSFYPGPRTVALMPINRSLSFCVVVSRWIIAAGSHMP
jgi:hypothetical protein